MKTFATTCCLVVVALCTAAATEGKSQLNAAQFAALCNSQGQDFDHPFTLSGDVDVRGGSATLNGCNFRVEAGARLRFDHTSLRGCGFNFNVFGGDRSEVDIDHSTMRMGNQTYLLFDPITDGTARVSHSTLAQCGENDFSDVVVTAGTDGSGGDVEIDHSTLVTAATAPEGAVDFYGHVVAFAPTGAVRVQHSSLVGTLLVVGTYPGGTCKADHNTPEVTCMLF